MKNNIKENKNNSKFSDIYFIIQLFEGITMMLHYDISLVVKVNEQKKQYSKCLYIFSFTFFF